MPLANHGLQIPGGEFRVGDLVYHRWDPDTYIYRIVRYEFGTVFLEGIGERTAPSANIETERFRHNWLLSRHTAPDELVYTRRAIPYFTGAQYEVPQTAPVLEMWDSLRPISLDERACPSSVWNFWFGPAAAGVLAAEVRVTLPLLIEQVRAFWNSGGVRTCAKCARGLQVVKLALCNQHVECRNCGTAADACAMGRRDCGHCVDCCGHRRCACGCGLVGSDVCAVCSLLSAHGCSCPTCEEPARACRRAARACCGRCANHCDCAQTCFPLVKNTFKFFDASKGDKLPARYIGTELEILGSENYPPSLRKAVKTWHANITTDSSIGGTAYGREGRHRKGMELVTAPAGGSAWLKMISEIGAGLADAKAIVASSCGQHVHVSAQDFDVWSIARLIRLYAHIEDTLFEALPAERPLGDFAKPCGQKYLKWLGDDFAKLRKRMTKKMFAQKLYGLSPVVPAKKTKAAYKMAAEADEINIRERAERKYDNTRYNALNLHSYWHRGTVEFRHAHGTANPKQITEWGLVCMHIVEFAAKGTEAQLRAALGAHPRDVFRKFLKLPSHTIEWLEGRWDLFTTAAGTRKKIQPQRDPQTGEV